MPFDYSGLSSYSSYRQAVAIKNYPEGSSSPLLISTQQNRYARRATMVKTSFLITSIVFGVTTQATTTQFMFLLCRNSDAGFYSHWHSQSRPGYPVLSGN